MDIDKLSQPADLFEFVMYKQGPIPTRIDPKKRGVMSRYFLSFVDGFIARMGGSLDLYGKDNVRSSSLRHDGKKLLISVLDRVAVSVSAKGMEAPPITIGSPGKPSHMIMYSGDQKYYVYVTPAGKIGVRKSIPPTVKSKPAVESNK